MILSMVKSILLPKAVCISSGIKGTLAFANAWTGGLLLDATSFLDTGIQWGSAIVSVGGAVLLITGLSDYSEGKTQHNPNAKMEGLSKIIGGIAIVLIGIGLVPQIRSMFPE